MKGIFCVLLLASCLILAESAGVSRSFTSADGDALAAVFAAAQSSDGSIGNNLEQTYKGVWTLTNIGKSVPNKAKICDYAAKQLTGKNLEEFAQAFEIRSLLDCKDWNRIPSKIETAIKTVVEEAGSLPDLANAVQILKLAENKKLIKNNKLIALVNSISERMDDGGKYYAEEEITDSPSKMFLAGVALKTVSSIHELVGGFDSQTNSILETLGEQVETLFLLGEEDDAIFYFDEEDELSSLAVTSIIFDGAAAMAKISGDVLLEEFQIAGVAEFFASFADGGAIDVLYSSVKGLTAVNSLSTRPMVLTIGEEPLSTASKKKNSFVKIYVTDVLGQNLDDCKVFLIQANSYGESSAVVLENQELFREDNYFGLNFLAVKPSPGYYELEMRVVSDSKKYFSINQVTRIIKVTATVSVFNFKINIGDSATGPGREIMIDYPSKLEAKLRPESYQTFSGSFRLKNSVTSKPLRAHQAFVSFTNEETGDSYSYIATRQGNLYKFEVDMGEVREDVNLESGDYSVSILIGDPCLENPLDWTFATAHLEYPPKPEVVSPYEPLPVIVHQFRPAPNRLPGIVSLGFSGLVLAPLLLLLGGWAAIGLNAKNFPGGANSLAALGFVGGIGGLMAWLVFYWLFLNMFQCFWGLLVLGTWTYYTGRQTLRAIASHRLKKQE